MSTKQKKWKPKVEYRDPSTLIPYSKNAKVHSKKQIEKIAGAISAFGFTQPIVVDKDSVIIAGHGRREAALQLLLNQVPVVVADHLSEDEVIAARIADNKVSEAPWDQDLLKFDLDTLKLHDFKLDMTGFELTDLKGFLESNEVAPQMFGGLPTASAEPLTAPNPVKKMEPQSEEDSVPDKVESRAKLGDIFQLGEHRLMCGDSTSDHDVTSLMISNVAKLVFTDPPYGVSYQSNMRDGSKKFDVIKNDEVFLDKWIPLIGRHSTGWVFAWTAWKVLTKWIDITRPIGELTNLIIWDKGGGGIGDLTGTFATDFEVALVFNRGAKITGKRLGSVWSIGKDAAINYVHPTQKPVDLAVMAIENCSSSNDAVLDLFGGSGSTLIACEKTNRRCFMMELDPHYCDVILTRWEKFTGKKSMLIEPCAIV